MTIVTQLVRWGSLVVVVTVIAMTTYFIAIPFLLGDLWPEAHLPWHCWLARFFWSSPWYAAPTATCRFAPK